MKAILQESEILAALAEEIVRDLDPDYPIETTVELPAATHARLAKIVGMALQPEEDYREDADDFALALQLRTDPVILDLLSLRWKKIELLDKFGNIALYF